MAAFDELSRGTCVAAVTVVKPGHFATLLGVSLATVVTLFANTTPARAAWDEISRVLGLAGPPAPASANVLSEHHLEEL